SLSRVRIFPFLFEPHRLLQYQLKIARRAVKLGARRVSHTINKLKSEGDDAHGKNENCGDKHPQYTLDRQTSIFGNHNGIKPIGADHMQGPKAGAGSYTASIQGAPLLSRVYP